MLTNVGRVRVNENLKERRENLCSFIFFGRILLILQKQKKIIIEKFVLCFQKFANNFNFAGKIIEDYCKCF
jgi:hypothetical protein